MGLGYTKNMVCDALTKIGKSKLARTEEFSVQEFIDFIKILKENN
mgnify:FL=1